MKKIFATVLLVFLFFTRVVLSDGADFHIKEESENQTRRVDEVPTGKIDPYLAEIGYSGGEFFQYDVSWTGGIKIGEIYLQIDKAEQCADCYKISSTISSSGGIVHRLYPIKDVHTTLVKGEERLPFFGEIWQKQGRNYRAHKLIHFDQEKHIIVKQKEGEAAETFNVDGVVHNEFSSFLSSRVMNLEIGQPIRVPTFGDDKRHDIIVETLKRGVLDNSVFGKVNVLKVTPILTFTGLYDKSGDTIVWYTDDECRVPVLIHSKIFIGSLTASLVKYRNPVCDRYNSEGIK